MNKMLLFMVVFLSLGSSVLGDLDTGLVFHQDGPYQINGLNEYQQVGSYTWSTTGAYSISFEWTVGQSFPNGSRLFYVPQTGNYGYFGSYYDEKWLPWRGFSCSWGNGQSGSGHAIFPHHAQPGDVYDIVCIFDRPNGVTRMYVNGVQGQVLDTQTSYGIPQNIVGIGETGASRAGVGVFKDIRVYNRVLSSEEVLLLRDPTSPPPDVPPEEPPVEPNACFEVVTDITGYTVEIDDLVITGATTLRLTSGTI